MLPSNNSSKTESFKAIQNVFTQYLRDPENNPAPTGVEDRRMAVYRELVYNNIEGFIANSFPVLRKITADKQWHEMLRDYVHRHKSHTPLFPKMPQEFLQYLELERNQYPDDYPFLFELAHYEWIETALSLDTREINFDNVDKMGNLLEGVPVLSPLSIALSYAWPVHKISPQNIPKDKLAQTYLLVYRSRDYVVGFIELNPVSAKLIAELTSNIDKTGKQILDVIAKQLDHPDPDIVIKGGLEMMQDFRAKDIVLGTK